MGVMGVISERFDTLVTGVLLESRLKGVRSTCVCIVLVLGKYFVSGLVILWVGF
jgi:hypothetical protein